MKMKTFEIENFPSQKFRKFSLTFVWKWKILRSKIFEIFDLKNFHRKLNENFEIENFRFFRSQKFSTFSKSVSNFWYFQKTSNIFFYRSGLNFDAHPFPVEFRSSELGFFTVLAALQKIPIFFHHVQGLLRGWKCGSHAIQYKNKIIL